MNSDTELFSTLLKSYAGTFVLFIYLLARDWIRDKKYGEIRKDEREQYPCKLKELNTDWLEKYECQFDRDEKRRLEEIRDQALGIHTNKKRGD